MYLLCVTRYYQHLHVQGIISTKNDNYMNLLIDEESNTAAIVDPVNPEKVSRSFMMFCLRYAVSHVQK